jgi:hypothetical protein
MKSVIKTTFIILFFLAGTVALLSGCGNGGGGSGTTTAVTTSGQVTGGASPSMNVYLDEYSDENEANIPYVNVYVEGSAIPIHLLLDTGATGVMINRSALTNAGIASPQSNFYFSGQFGDGGAYSGFVAFANVSTSGGLTAQNMPVAVAETDTDFPSSGFLQGDFGMGLSPYFSFGTSGGTIFTPSFDTALSSGYNNGFKLNFNNIIFNAYGYNNNIGDTVPVGTITYGLSAIPSGSNFYPNASGQEQAFPSINSKFGGQSQNSTGYTFYSYFDTGSNFIYLGTDALDYGVALDASTNDVYSCGGLNLIYGNLTLFLSLFNNTSYINNNFTTSPFSPINNDFCDSVYNVFSVASGYALALDNAIVYGGFQQGQEDFGLPFMFSQPMYWQAQSPSAAWGVGIDIISS